MSSVGLDTSIAVPLLVESHRAHALVMERFGAGACALCGHAVAETYSVLTRLPGDARHTAASAARLMAARLVAPLLLSHETAAELPARLATAGVTGGAVYDALVGLAAAEHDVTLATRDGRARRVYEAVGARVLIVG